MMTMGEMFEKLLKKPYLEIGPNDLAALLAQTKPVREETPGGRGPIRLFRSGGRFLFQETSDKGEILVRSFPSREEADRFVENRLDLYDMMWDGCGCKIDYYE
ncbi:MAG: hypothetical protein ABIK65_00760 [Candidatus Eisenbacteria bacterium]